MVTRSSERGSALIMAILAAALIGTAVMLLSQDLNDRQRLLRHKVRKITTGHLCDAVFAETLAELSNDPDFSGVPFRQVEQGVIGSLVNIESAEMISISAEAEFDGLRSILEAEISVDDVGLRVERWDRYFEPVQGSSRLFRRKSSNFR